MQHFRLTLCNTQNHINSFCLFDFTEIICHSLEGDTVEMRSRVQCDLFADNY